MATEERGQANYTEIIHPKYGEPHLVPLKIANEESLAPFGKLVRDFEAEKVWITVWPQKGWRQVCAGTGQDGGITEGKFCTSWNGDVIVGSNEAVDGNYIMGRLPTGVASDNRSHVLIREANYHPDGGQVFYPQRGNAFVLVLALPGDNITPQDFVAFYFDGSFGVQIKADIWHQGLFPIDDEAVFIGKQGKVHACVIMDTIEEFGAVLKVPLRPELAS